MTLATQEDLAAFEARAHARHAQLVDRIDDLCERFDAFMLIIQNHGTALGEMQALLPKLVAARPSRAPETPTPRLAEVR